MKFKPSGRLVYGTVQIDADSYADISRERHCGEGLLGRVVFFAPTKEMTAMGIQGHIRASLSL